MKRWVYRRPILPSDKHRGYSVPLYLVPVAILSGTATDGITEQEIRVGGDTIIITLHNDTWVTSGANFNAQRQNIINGLDSAQSEGTGWNAEVRDKEVVGAVVRDSDTQVTITLTAAAAYATTADETITVAVPASALITSAVAVIANVPFSVTNESTAAFLMAFTPLAQNIVRSSYM